MNDNMTMGQYEGLITHETLNTLGMDNSGFETRNELVNKHLSKSESE